MILSPLTIGEAKVFINEHHRHHEAPQGALFAIGASEAGEIIGCILVGRPVARMNNDSWTAEVTRLCVNFAPKNTCSMLYAAAWRACRAMGYRRLITYTLDSEPGTSVKAAGWKCVGKTKGGSWSRESRPRVDKHPLQAKLIWEISDKRATAKGI